ncbi:uncharacterized protein [Antedon mediterranea]|uniref:uncharacterized protein n=1 Tax=Antedon mediterranea TaxID=105859 RepID=UPI003AF9C8C2
MALEALEGANLMDLTKVSASLSDQNSNTENCMNKCDEDTTNIDNDSIEPSSPRGEGDGGVTTNIDDLMEVAELPTSSDILNDDDIPVEKTSDTDVEPKVFEDTEVIEGEVVSCSPVPNNTAVASGDIKPSDILVNDETPKSPILATPPSPVSPPPEVPQSPVKTTTDETINNAEKAPAIDSSVDSLSIVTNPSETSEDSKSQMSTESEDKTYRLMNGVPEKVKEQKVTKTNSGHQRAPRSNKSSLLRSTPKPPPENKLTRLAKVKTTTPKKRPVSTQRTSGSGDESERLNSNKAVLTAADPIPDSQSDFKPGQFWEAKKAISQVKAKKTLDARKDFAKSNKLFGVKPMPHDPSPPPMRRATSKASMAGGEKTHTKVEPNPYGGPGEKYLTPLQQRDKQVKDLHHYVASLEGVIEEKDLLIESFEQQKIDSVKAMEAKKTEEKQVVEQTLKKSQEETAEVRQKLEETERTLSKREEKINRLEKVIVNMEQEYEEREGVHQERYLEMYQKGMAAMTIEHDEELVAGAQADPKSANIKQLLKKLEKTEMELAKVRETKRLEVYEGAIPLESDSEARVELLKSAVYYFLTDKEPDNNLKTMLSMLNYSEVQKTNIRSHIKKKKKK